MNKRQGFTLIELLVVITIIVVLLALLAPALDQAIYQAELAVCGTKQRAIADGAALYAAGNQRRYPHRKGASDPNLFWQPHMLYNGSDYLNTVWAGYRGPKLDERPMLRSFMNVNATLNDPLVAKVDLEGSTPETHVFGSYTMWFGWRYRHASGGRGMFKLGDRFEWNSQAYDLLASDADVILHPSGFGAVQTNHPDALNRTQNQVYQDRQWAAGSSPATYISMTISTWMLDGSGQRGPTDLNFAYSDGSVRRYNGVTWDGWQGNAQTMDKLPIYSNARDARSTTVPSQ